MRRRLAGTLLALPLSVGLALAGCGDSGSDPGVATAEDASGAAPSASAAAMSDEDRQLKFTQCMRDNGVDLPDPETVEGRPRIRPEGNVDQEKLGTALEKCRSLLPNGGEPMKLSPEQVEQMRQLASCIRENGVPDFPDPNADGNLDIGSMADKIDPQDPKVRAALEKCRQLAPQLRQSDR